MVFWKNVIFQVKNVGKMCVFAIGKTGKIDFVLQNGMEIIPVEAKGGEDKSAPSFKRYIAEHQPKRAIRFSRRGYVKNGMITNIPLYLARKTKTLL